MQKRIPGMFGGRSVLDEHGQLWAELEVYSEAEARVEAEEAARARRRSR